jgi:hypothetical protein
MSARRFVEADVMTLRYSTHLDKGESFKGDPTDERFRTVLWLFRPEGGDVSDFACSDDDLGDACSPCIIMCVDYVTRLYRVVHDRTRSCVG